MDINLNTITKLPAHQKLIILIVIIVLLSGAFYFNFYGPKGEELKNLTVRLEDARRRLEESKKVQKELKKVEEEIVQLNRKFERVKAQLPNEKEIPGLLTSISNAGRESGLEFLLFRPNKEVPKGFYAEVPVNIEVKGGYHNLAVFFEKVMNLPRIVNIANINMGGAKDVDGRIVLKSSFMATTFRFIPEEARSEKNKKKKR